MGGDASFDIEAALAIEAAFLARERDAFMAGVYLAWDLRRSLWVFDAKKDWDSSDVDEAFDAYQRAKMHGLNKIA